MIIKNFEIKKYIDKKKIFLIYGLNEGLKDEIVNRLHKQLPERKYI